MADKMEALLLLLMFFTVPGYSYVLQPKSTMTQIAGLDRDHQSELRGIFTSAEERGNGERRSEGASPETNPVRTPVKRERPVEERGEDELKMDRNQGYAKGIQERRNAPKSNPKNWLQVKSHNTGTQEEETHDDTDVKFKQMEKLRQEIVDEERKSRLVAGISEYYDRRGDAPEDEKIVTAEKGGNEEREELGEDVKNAKNNEWKERQREDHMLVPLLRTAPAQVESVSAAINTLTPIPPRRNHHNLSPLVPFTPTLVSPLSSLPSTPYSETSPQFFPADVFIQNPSVSTVVPGVVRFVSPVEDLLFEEQKTPGYHLKQNQEVKAGPNVEDETDKHVWPEPAQKEAQEIHTVVQPESEITPGVQEATLKPKEAEFITRDLSTKEPDPITKSNENIATAELVNFTHKPNMTRATGKPGSDKLMENDTKLAVRQNKSSLSRPPVAKTSARPRLATARTPSTRPTKINRTSKNKTVRKSKDNKGKKDNKTNKTPSERKKKVTAPTPFPYFLDNYCPPECACYGRVVQCSDKGVDKVPYGIPYNARYVLLMNNHIDSIQLDLLKEYVSMEFLVLSNNRLTDGAVEGAFEGIPALKRLYLDRNLLESIPTDLPFSLEELRLDNNHVGVMSEDAWARCPGLLVLSLSNNSLGNGSDSPADAVLSPLSNLRTLNLNHNQLTLVPMGLPLSIKELYLKGNVIEQFRAGAFNGISELVVLDLSANRLTNKGLLRESLLNTTHLESLNLEGNRLKQVPRHLPRSLKTLNLEGNLISSIKKAAFSTVKNLEHLGLARNKIFKVAIGAFRMLPVLHQLDLCHNTLRQVPRQLPQGLHSVALTHNKIQSVPRDAFCWGNKSLSPSRLVQVQLEHNLIDMGKLDAQAFRCLRGFQVVHFY
ncbi:wu:fc23c09 [Platichthys flesus]|uniref:wu:fc23c09 n=1 Tax=Platichthys flesus TaxID=8260 RepID=UPI002DB9FCE6|nr:wu:fc23c09 [Platichthys flesus]XP_062238941.1 wu:fc23c09 [Platichthys flesus]